MNQSGQMITPSRQRERGLDSGYARAEEVKEIAMGGPDPDGIP